jgi:2'-5' RNA ligase
MSPAVAAMGDAWGGGYGSALPRPAADFTDGSFGPLSPLDPIPIDQPPDGFDRPMPRRWQYPFGWNIPRSLPRTEGVTLTDFGTLRSLAQLYSVARACIQLLKSEIRALEWDIVPTKDAAKAMRGDHKAMRDFGERRSECIRFFKNPDPEYGSWSSWLDTLLEDIYAIDAASVYLRPSRVRGRGLMGSDLSALEIIDGSSFRPLVDLHGSRPTPPSPAYEQYIYGIPRTDNISIMCDADLSDDLRKTKVQDYRGDQLLYLPYTRAANRPYGSPPIEQALVPVMSGLSKQGYQLDYYRSGSIPGLFVSPGDAAMTASQIRDLETALNVIAGDVGMKHQIVVLPPGSKVMPQKPPELADQFDMIVSTEVCMAFQVQPTELGLMPQVATVQSPSAMNQASKADAARHQRKSLVPMLQFLKQGLLDKVIQVACGQTDMQFLFEGLEEDEDEVSLTGLLGTQIGTGLRSVDEGRGVLGLDPWGLPVTQDPLWASANGVMLLGSVDPATGQPGGQLAGLPSVTQQMQGAQGGSAGGSPGANEGQVSGRPALAQGHMPGTTHVPPAQPDRDPTPSHSAAIAGAAEAAAAVSGSSSKAAASDPDGLHRYEPYVPGDQSACVKCSLPRSYAAHAVTAIGSRMMLKAIAEPAAPRPADHVLAEILTAPDAASLSKEALAALAPCACCGGAGEHETGHECYRCDGYRVPEAEAKGSPWCEEVFRDQALHVQGCPNCGPPPFLGSGSSKAALSELDALGRHVRKGRDPATWQPVHIPGHVMAMITEDVTKGIGIAEVLTEARRALPKSRAASGGQQRQAWLAWEHDLQLAAKYEQQIGAAFSSVMTEAGKLFAAFLAGTLAVTAAVLASMIADLIRQRLALILAPLHAEGRELGRAAAMQAAGASARQRQGIAAAQQADTSQIAQQAAVRQMAGTGLAGFTVALMKLLLGGAVTVGALLALLDAFLNAENRAGLIALTEIEKAIADGAFGVYTELGVSYVRWHTRNDSRVCARCMANQDAGPVPLGSLFPGGVAQPCQHPGCRCWLAPSDPPKQGVAPPAPGTAKAAGAPLLYQGPVHGGPLSYPPTMDGEAGLEPATYGTPAAVHLTKADKPWKHPDTSLPVAEQVYAQLLEDYPASALTWVKDATWTGPQEVPLSAIEYTPDKWQAGHEDAKVDRFKAKIERRQAAGRPVKPAVLIDRPDTKPGTHLIVIDGHHRALAFRELDRPVVAYVGKVTAAGAKLAEETHSSQFSDQKPGAGDDGRSTKNFTAANLGDGSVHGLAPYDLRGQDAPKEARGYSLSKRSGMISLDLPEGLIEPLPGGITDHHVTVVYLGPDVDDDAFSLACVMARRVAAATQPLSGTIGGIGSFPAGDDGVPVWAGVNLPGAESLHEALAELQSPDAKAREHGYKPHCTIAYLEEGDPLPDPLPHMPVTFTHLSVHRGEDVKHFPFGDVGKSAATPYLSTVHHPLGHEGLWHTPSKKVPERQQLPAYVQNIAAAIERDHGVPESEAIAMAVAAVERWRHGNLEWGPHRHVTPEVAAASERTHEEWEHLRATHDG